MFSIKANCHYVVARNFIRTANTTDATLPLRSVWGHFSGGYEKEHRKKAHATKKSP